MLSQLRQLPDTDKLFLSDSMLEAAGVEHFEELDSKQCLDLFRYVWLNNAVHRSALYAHGSYNLLAQTASYDCWDWLNF